MFRLLNMKGHEYATELRLRQSPLQ